jgi:hypothetical protein
VRKPKLCRLVLVAVLLAAWGQATRYPHISILVQMRQDFVALILPGLSFTEQN